jgi:hypothetical protein
MFLSHHQAVQDVQEGVMQEILFKIAGTHPEFFLEGGLTMRLYVIYV